MDSGWIIEIRSGSKQSGSAQIVKRYSARRFRIFAVLIGGGVRLAKAADTIRIGKLVRETEDQLAIVECFDAATNTCRLSGSCRLKGALSRAMTAFYDSLDEHTLQDLVVNPQRSRMIKILLPSEN